MSDSNTILKPKIHESVFIAEGARIYGDVEIHEGASVWFNAVIRGDEGKIIIGKNTNIQDNVVLHSDMNVGIEIGNNCTIGHGAIIRGCKIGEMVMIGMNSTIMTNSVIGDNSVVGANSFVPYNKEFPSRSMIVGSPAKISRELREDEIGFSNSAVEIYKQLVKDYTEKRILSY